MRLPVRYFDSTQTGVLVSRIMSDADGLRNLVGTGLVQLVGGLVTAVIGLGVLFWLNWHLTVDHHPRARRSSAAAWRTPSARCGRCSASAARSTREVTGRLTEALGGIRVVKSYTAEKREEIVFTKGAHRLFRNVAKSMTGVSASTAGGTVIVGVIGVLMIWLGGRAILAGEMTLGELVMYIVLHRRWSPRRSSRSRRSARRSPRRSPASIASARSSTCRPSSTRTRTRAPVPRSSATCASRTCGSSTTRAAGAARASRSRRRAGTTTALVGSSGSGKSTLISLVMAFNRPLRGRIADRRRATSATCGWPSTAAQLASVLQENFLFDGTIAGERGLRPARARRARRSWRPAASRTATSSSREFPRGLRHGRRRARHQAVGRAAPARLDRPRDPRRSRASSSWTRRRRASTARASR